MNAASLVNDCLPLPPTPTNNAFPPGIFRIRLNLEICSIANPNITKSIGLRLC